MKMVWIPVAAVVIAGQVVAAQPALLTNGVVRTEAVSGSLEGTFKALAAQVNDAAWIGYAVPKVPGDHFMCDWDDAQRVRPVSTAVKLEGSTEFHVLFRVEARRVTRIRMFSEGCALDAGGRTIHWLTGVVPRESVALLRPFAEGSDRRLADGSAAALAMHAEPSALEALVTIARSGTTTRAKGQALFWLAQRAGDRAVGAISEALDRDPDTDVKKRAVFALSQLPKDEGVPRLIDVARSHSNPAVRKQAMFWLGQSRDPRALAFFESILLR
jgi:hypothetical protein